MRDPELECVPGWRYCNVKAGDKRPYPDGWQNTPLTLQQVANGNVGILLGTPSGGIAALDFDGTSAWNWFAKRIGCEIPDTVTWTSGKQDRCQMAFVVPEKYWPYIKTIKITHTRDDLIAEGEGFEFRWTGAQSVLPPSRLNDGREYTWINEPSRHDIPELPDDILAYWLDINNPAPAPTVDYPPATTREVEELAAELKHYYPTLEGYDLWTSVCWGFCNTIGYADGIQLMKYYWPEQRPGEYDNLISKPSGGKKYSIGTIKWLIGQKADSISKQQRQQVRYTSYQTELNELMELQRLIKEKLKDDAR